MPRLSAAVLSTAFLSGAFLSGAALLAPLPAAARASEAEVVVDAFYRLCMANEAVPAKTLAAADAGGWAAGQDPDWRQKTVGQTELSLLVYATPEEDAAAGRVSGYNCMVGVSGAVTPGLAEAMTARVGKKPDRTEADKMLWGYQKTASGPRPLPDDAPLSALAAGPSYTYGVVSKENAFNAVILTVVKLQPK